MEVPVAISMIQQYPQVADSKKCPVTSRTLIFLVIFIPHINQRVVWYITFTVSFQVENDKMIFQFLTMKTKFLLTIAFFGFLFTCFGQQNLSWERWNGLIGEWVGEGSGIPGQGGGGFSFKFDLNKKILIRKSHSEYLANKDKSANIHEDLMIVYPDSTGTPCQAIYFDNENHVIHYNITCSVKSIQFTSDKKANAPVFRLTYFSIDDSTVNTKFEMSHDGDKFMTYIEGKSKKKK
ncbi:MAG: hypothetical protein ABSE72_01425 [Bacteroidales bacterium]|jgi:hypothetical protein